MSGASVSQAEGLIVRLPDSLRIEEARLKPVVQFNILQVEGREGPKRVSIPESTVREIMSWADSRPQEPGELSLRDVARYANTQFHDLDRSVLAVERVVTFEGTDPGDGVRLVKGPDPRYSRVAWIDANRFLTPSEAERTQYGGRTALKWAMRGGEEIPERIVQARGGYFYPCGLTDVSVSVER